MAKCGFHFDYQCNDVTDYVLPLILYLLFVYFSLFISVLQFLLQLAVFNIYFTQYRRKNEVLVKVSFLIFIKVGEERCLERIENQNK